MTSDDAKKPYIIAETAYNHEGDFAYLNRMVDDIANLGVDAIKFHLLLSLDSYMTRTHPLYEKVKQWMFTSKQWDEIFKKCQRKSLGIIALCDDVESIQYILKKNIQGLELHATSINDYYMLSEATRFTKRIILGVGGSSLSEISYAVDFLRSHGRQDLLLMYGFQSYPTNYHDINLAKMNTIHSLFHCDVGYADHTAYNDPNNDVLSVGAAFMGYPVLEKHYTPDPGKERIDYHAAVGADQMKRIIHLMTIALQTHGTGHIAMSDPEKAYGNVGPMKKAIVARLPIKKGERLTTNNLWFKRTPQESTIPQKQFLQLLDSTANVPIAADEIIDFSKVSYKFKTLNAAAFTKTSEKK